MKAGLVGLIICLAALANAQGAKAGLVKPKAVARTSADNTVVSQAEARAAFARAEKIIRRATLTNAKAPSVAIPVSPRPATRAQCIKELWRLYQLTRPKVKLTPRALELNVGVVKVSDPTAKTQILALIRLGAVANYGALATGPTDRLSVAEFGDTLGYFLARMAHITHLPSSKWTPSLMGG